MKKLGRDDPCPCGSGKKYKNCCLDKNREGARAESNLIELESVRAAEPSAFDRFWDEFAPAPLEENLRLACEFIETGDDFDDEAALDIIEALSGPLKQAGRFDELKELIARIEQLHPEVYRKEAGWFNLILTEAALFQPEGDLLTPLLALAENLDDELVAPFFNLMDQLLYHGRGKELLAVTSVAWPRLQEMMDAEELMPDMVEELGELPLVLLICQCLDKNTALNTSDPEFLDQLKPFRKDELELFERITLHGSGRSARQWRIEDFQGPDQDLLFQNLFFLTLDFAAALRNQGGWTGSRATLALSVVLDLLCVAFEKARNKKKSLSKEQAATSLLPDPKIVDSYLAELLPFIFPQPYKAAAFGLALSPWLEFLAEQGLCGEDQIGSLRAELREVIKQLPFILKNTENDQALVSDIMACWELDESELHEPIMPLEFAEGNESSFPLMFTPQTGEELIQHYLAKRREQVEDKTLKPNTALLAALKKQPAGWIEGICNQAGITGFSRNPERIKALAEQLPRKETLALMWSKLPLESRRMLEYILNEGGHASLNKLSQKFGKDDDNTWFWNEGQTPATPLGLLRLHGLAFVGKTKQKKRRVKIAAIPVELREGLAEIAGSPKAFEGAPPLPERPDHRPPGEDEDEYLSSPGGEIKFEPLSEEERLPFIAEFIEQFPCSDHTRHNYEMMLEEVRASEEEGARDLLRRILERMAEGGNAAERLSAYKEGWKEFGDSFIEPALQDRAQSVREWASKLINPEQDRLF